ncbi:hypothetical protein K0B96_01025 [Horticoccus luteus]|uniref:Uncharacterized protein n=1 Tax=Horticoccus luteus TaxID=2862869 RepID=A0A8F9TTZ7_9BACT|nr:hypothetical protein [Horticoccus luteus]QYM79229.1 hypothetical protein K0B96_01025 [Horticoccus luteus]
MRLYEALLVCILTTSAFAQTSAEPGTCLWTSDLVLVTAPSITPDGIILARSANSLVAVSSDGNELWRAGIVAPNRPQRLPVDEDGNVYVTTPTELRSYSPTGSLRWSRAMPFSSSPCCLSLADDLLIVLTSSSRYAFRLDGSLLWPSSTGNAGLGESDTNPPTWSPLAIVDHDGLIRIVQSTGQVHVLEPTGHLVRRDEFADHTRWGESASVTRQVGLGPRGESIVLNDEDGESMIRWTEPFGIGTAYSVIVPGSEAGDEWTSYGLVSASGELFLATNRGTLLVPYRGFGFRRWPETAFALTADGGVVCADGAQLTLRNAAHTVVWRAPAPGTFFTLGADGRVYGGITLSAYHIGQPPAADSWAQPNGDAAQRNRATVPPTSDVQFAASTIETPASVTWYESYPGSFAAAPYINGGGTLTWIKDDVEVAPAAADFSFAVAAATPGDAGEYRLQATTAQGTILSPPIKVAVTAPSPIQPGFYTGTLPLGSGDKFLLELTPDRTVRFLSVSGWKITQHNRLDPAGIFPWDTGIIWSSDPSEATPLTLHCDATGVAASWGGQPLGPLTFAPARLPSGARVGWYRGTREGLIVDSAKIDAALFPDGTLAGLLSGRGVGVAAPAVDLNPALLEQQVEVPLYSSASKYALISFTPEGVLRVNLGGRGGGKDSLVAVHSSYTRAARLSNLSARAVGGSGDRAVIAGFVVATGGSFLLRGAGPALAAYGVPNPSLHPTLTLRHSPDVFLASNTGWSNNAANEITRLATSASEAGAFPFAAGSADCALLLPIPPGVYTITITDQTEGETLAEIYGLASPDGAPAAQAVNLSIRGALSRPDERLIIGLVLKSDLPQPILLRGVGPGLARFLGAVPVCQNPRLRVFDAGGNLMAGSDDWSTSWDPPPGGMVSSQQVSVADAALQAGAFALNNGSHDAALVYNLAAGVYTVHLESKDGSTGAVLFEAYVVPD